MKKRLLSLFSLALLVASSAWAQETYQIGTAEELEAFALKVNEGEINANAVLTADIDYSSCAEMIGTVSGPYARTFEGQGHKITIGFSTSENYAGLFRYFGGTIKNLIVDGTLSTSAQFAAGVAGYVVAGSVIENCVCSVDIISSVVGDGSHGGIASLSFGLTLKNSRCILPL